MNTPNTPRRLSSPTKPGDFDPPISPTKPTIPARRSSKRKAPPTDTFNVEEARQLHASSRELSNAIRIVTKQLKPKASQDSDYWKKSSELCSLQRDLNQIKVNIKYREFVDAGGNMTREDWLHENEEAQKLSDASASYESLRSISANQAIRLQPNSKQPRSTLQVPRRMREAFMKLFNASRLGFNLNSWGNGARDSRQQSAMKAAMSKAYGVNKTTSWDPVLGRGIESIFVRAAHLFPYRSNDFMDSIFGEGSENELFSPFNGLFLHPKVEDALDKGIIAIIPNIDLEDNGVGTHPALDNEKLVAWQMQKVKDYKIWVLGKDNKKATEKVFDRNYGYPVDRIVELHNRPLHFKNEFRPRSRYVWWTFLNSVQQYAARQTNANFGVRQEVLNSTRFWGTQGRYVYQNYLLGFVEELGQALDPKAASVIVGNGREDEGSSAKEADPVAVAIMAREALFRSSEQTGSDSEAGSSDEDSEDDD